MVSRVFSLLKVKINELRYFLISALVVLLFDQAIKTLIRVFFERGYRYSLLDNLVLLTYIKNEGGLFGILPYCNFPFIIIGILVLGIIIYYTNLISSLRLRVALGLIFGGGLGNLIDRISTGGVIDYIDLGVGNYRWPVFNLADLAICLGVGMIIFYLWRSKEKV